MSTPVKKAKIFILLLVSTVLVFFLGFLSISKKGDSALVDSLVDRAYADIPEPENAGCGGGGCP